ncbi:MAG TPA: threonine/serine dehydratase [Candidatus Dormibacteraeota bacterium]|nr:threonine/serine dehydratase [Candidatus Dormibacteraeota bacterium]
MARAALEAPTLEDVVAARDRIRPYLAATPLRNYPSLDRLTGAEVWVKHENLLPTGAFKVRGGVNLMAQMDEATRARGVVTASTGNHGQSIAMASRLFGVRAIVIAPEGANPVKVEAMRDFGAEVVLKGRDYDESREYCEELAAEHGYRYIHSGDEPHLIAGVGTHTLEVLDERPDIDAVIVPVGGGSGASGACIVAKGTRPGIEVIGVQSAQAPTAHDSWREGSLVERPNTTVAEGLSTRTAFALPQRILRELLDDFVLVSDDSLLDAVAIMIEKTRTLVEPAGAASLAALLSPALADRLRGKRVALICSGANISPAQLRTVMGRKQA